MDERQVIRELLESGQLPTPEMVAKILQPEPPKVVTKTCGSSVEVVQSFHYEPKKIEVSDFANYFKSRYSFLKNLLSNRAEVESPTSISKLANAREKANIIGLISTIQKLPSGALKMIVEDQSGSINAIISSKDPELAKKASYLALDEVVALKGTVGKNTFFVNDIVWPDIPAKTPKKSPDEVYAAFTGDMHAGSNMFLPEQLEKFIKWTRGEFGDSSQKEMAQKTKYIFVLGDTVDGVGIYPEQEKELKVKDIYKQFELAAEFLSRIPEDKQIIICPGNHDGIRICEPQPPLYKDIAAPLYELPNVIHVSNPAVVNIHKQDGFPGFDVLMYHGYSFDYFVDAIEPLRLAGGYDAPDKIIEFLLKRRHLAPSYGSTLALPILNDPLLIKQVPDIIATGHIHKAKIAQYRGVLTIAASCWQARTSFQEKVGHHPEPSRVPIINLKTGQAKMLKFE